VTPGQRRALLAAARAARRRAYAPYSRFTVGAAVLDGAGRVHAGCNVENASYGLTVCAERNAAAAAVSAGDGRVAAVTVASGTSPPTPPCGACLQVLAELGSAAMPVLLAGPAGAPVATTLGALLPSAFSARHLAGAPAPRGGAARGGRAAGTAARRARGARPGRAGARRRGAR
jgi:cytidine deaminase